MSGVIYLPKKVTYLPGAGGGNGEVANERQMKKSRNLKRRHFFPSPGITIISSSTFFMPTFSDRKSLLPPYTLNRVAVGLFDAFATPSTLFMRIMTSRPLLRCSTRCYLTSAILLVYVFCIFIPFFSWPLLIAKSKARNLMEASF